MQHVSPNENDFTADYTAAQRTTRGHSSPQKPLDLNCGIAKWMYFTRWVEFFKLKLDGSLVRGRYDMYAGFSTYLT